VGNGKFTVEDRDKVPTAGKTAARGRVDEALKKRKVRPYFEVARRREVVDSGVNGIGAAGRTKSLARQSELRRTKRRWLPPLGRSYSASGH